MHWLEYLLLI